MIGAALEAAMSAAIVQLENHYGVTATRLTAESNPTSLPLSKLVKVSQAAGWLTPVTQSAEVSSLNTFFLLTRLLTRSAK